MLRLPTVAAILIMLAVALPGAARAEQFSLQDWTRIEDQAKRGDARAIGLRDGYLAGVRDALKFYSKVSKTFPICWPKDHEVDLGLVRDTVAAVRKGHPDIAKPGDNYAYIVVLSLYDAYPCR